MPGLESGLSSGLSYRPFEQLGPEKHPYWSESVIGLKHQTYSNPHPPGECSEKIGVGHGVGKPGNL